MNTTHHGLGWGPVEAVKVTVSPADAAPPKMVATMAEALAQHHRPSEPFASRTPGRGAYRHCLNCFNRWPCDTSLLIEEWRAERQRVQLLEEAIHLFRERVREYCDPSLGAEHPEDIDAALTELLACQEALFSLVRERQQ